LLGEGDLYGGVTVDLSKFKTFALDQFESELKESLHSWRTDGVRGVWLKIPIEHATCVPGAASQGFQFHHAQPKYVMMTAWLPEDEPSSIPPYASHFVGVGGFVVDEANRVLVVQEKYGHTEAHWKLPGGLADPGEELGDVAVREVLEETGIHSTFEALACFRHMHNYRFGCGDLYFIALLRASSTAITACPREIQACCWLPIEDYMNSELVHPTNRHIASVVLAHLLQGPPAPLLQPVHIPSYDMQTHNSLFSACNQQAARVLAYVCKAAVAPTASAAEDDS